MRVLGIDFGQKRVGLAITDPDGIMAYPLATLAFSSPAKLIEDLEEIVAENLVEAVVLGLPLGLSMQETVSSLYVRSLASELLKSLSVPLMLINEALTSAEAATMLRETGMKRNKTKNVLDQLAAVRILETYLQDPTQAEVVAL